jgi:REP element-mobilizing transposase RayT
MSNTFTQIYLHVVFSVKNRKMMINDKIREHLYMYITGIITKQNHKLYLINGMPDHVHLLFGIRPDSNLSELIKEIKACSSKYINESGFSNELFHWQNGFGAFSVSSSQREKVYLYIENQETHHENRTFEQEFLELLKAHGIKHELKYVFD